MASGRHLRSVASVYASIPPETGVAGHPPVASRGQQRQQREPPTLRSDLVPGFVGQGQAAERLKPEHELQMSEA